MEEKQVEVEKMIEVEEEVKKEEDEEGMRKEMKNKMDIVNVYCI